MEKFLTVLCITGLSWTASWAQVDCANIGFETGAITGWAMTYGTVDDNNQKVVYLNETNGTQNGEHYITSLGDGNDLKISVIPMVAPGSTHSIRIGNTTTGTHFSRISTNYLVAADHTLFQYSFAVLLQNTGSGQGGEVTMNHTKNRVSTSRSSIATVGSWRAALTIFNCRVPIPLTASRQWAIFNTGTGRPARSTSEIMSAKPSKLSLLPTAAPNGDILAMRILMQNA